MRAFEILNEMVVRTERGENDNLIAHRDSIWFLPSNDIAPEVSAEIEARTGLYATDNYADYEEQGRDGRHDVLFGRVDHKNLYVLSVDDTGMNPVTSLLIRKVVKQLGLETVEKSYTADYGDGDEYEELTRRHEMLGRIPDVVFHGTNGRFMRDIRSKGLGPNKNANWSRIGKFYDRIFLTSRMKYAQFHANRTTQSGGGPPIIVATHIPNRDLIVPDFDVAGTYYGSADQRTNAAGYTGAMNNSGYAHSDTETFTKAIRTHSNKTDYTRESGVFGYKGRIAPTFFQYFVVPGDAEQTLVLNDNAVKVAPADIWKALDMIDEYGFYDPNAEDDWEEQEDDQADDRY